MAGGLSRLDGQLDSPGEAANYQNASRKCQVITVGADDVTVTLRNPHSIQLADADAATVYFRLAGEDSTWCPVYFPAGKEMVKEVAAVGGTSRGTTATTVIVYGV